MKKVLSIVLTIAMVISLMPSVVFAADNDAYTDIKGLKCEAAVMELTELGIVNGYEESDGTYTFRPDNPVTRAEMSKLTVAALGLDPTTGTTQFTDMDQAKWAIPYVGYAESLGIVKGYGNGKFGPNDKVTYDQAITMIVRMLGYTDESQELQGTWPANYVQKANELGILKDVNKTGSENAPRGDIAIMLANALDLAMVYVDKDGKTTYKTGKDRASVDDFENPAYVTIRGTLTKEAGSGYTTITQPDVENAATNIREFMGAAGKIVYNEDEEIINVSDIKTQFLTGTFKEEGVFTSDDVDYKIPNPVPYKRLNWSTGKPVDVSESSADYAIPIFYNGYQVNQNYFTRPMIMSDDATFILAATVSGKKITGIYSYQVWIPCIAQQVDDAAIAQIEKNHKLLNASFVEDEDGEIDMDALILAGVDSLDEIAADNVVYIYTNPNGIAKIEVGTEVVTGMVSKSKSGKYAVIDGKEYSFASRATSDTMNAATSGNEVEAYLDYNGDIFYASVVSSGNYAVVMETDGAWKAATTFSSDNNKIRLLTEDGAKIFEVNNSKLKIDGAEGSSKWDTLEPGQFVKVTYVDEMVKEITTLEGSDLVRATKVSKQGYFDSKKVNDTALVIAAPYENEAFVWDGDDADYSILKKSDILETKITAKYYADGGKIEVIYFDNSAISESEYGVAYDTYMNEDRDTVATYYVGKESKEAVVNGNVPRLGTELYEVSTAADGAATFSAVPVTETFGYPVYSAKGNEVLLTSDQSVPFFLTDDVVIYIWDPEEGTLSADGIVSDLISDDVDEIAFYSTAAEGDDNYGLFNYIIITKYLED